MPNSNSDNNIKNYSFFVTAQQHRICFVIGLLMCEQRTSQASWSALLPTINTRIYSTAKQLHSVAFVQFRHQAE